VILFVTPVAAALGISLTLAKIHRKWWLFAGLLCSTVAAITYLAVLAFRSEGSTGLMIFGIVFAAMTLTTQGAYPSLRRPIDRSSPQVDRPVRGAPAPPTDDASTWR